MDFKIIIKFILDPYNKFSLNSVIYKILLLKYKNKLIKFILNEINKSSIPIVL